MPFVTAGDPDLGFTADCLKQLDAAGCHLVELGIPYSDPIADGPVIQASYTRALNRGVKLNEILEMVRSIRAEIRVPIVAMISYAIVFRYGLDEFIRAAGESGIAGAIVPDMPVDESQNICRKMYRRRFQPDPVDYAHDPGRTGPEKSPSSPRGSSTTFRLRGLPGSERPCLKTW